MFILVTWCRYRNRTGDFEDYYLILNTRTSFHSGKEQDFNLPIQTTLRVLPLNYHDIRLEKSNLSSFSALKTKPFGYLLVLFTAFRTLPLSREEVEANVLHPNRLFQNTCSTVSQGILGIYTAL